MTVARIVGEAGPGADQRQHAVPGAFTREAWEKYVAGAIKEASNKELQSTDWVLKTVTQDDLTLEGSPEQIQKALVDMYKSRVREGMAEVRAGRDDRRAERLRRQRARDEPAGRPADVADRQAARRPSTSRPRGTTRRGRRACPRSRRACSPGSRKRCCGARRAKRACIVDLPADAGAAGAAPAMGPIGREFAGVARLVGVKEKERR